MAGIIVIIGGVFQYHCPLVFAFKVDDEHRLKRISYSTRLLYLLMFCNDVQFMFSGLKYYMMTLTSTACFA